jgi:hypothetical protein
MQIWHPVVPLVVPGIPFSKDTSNIPLVRPTINLLPPARISQRKRTKANPSINSLARSKSNSSAAFLLIKAFAKL